jgi:hemerythrin HHE cation binding domain-containing protein
MIASNFGDIVDVLLDQHQKLRQLCADVQSASGKNKTLLLRDLARLVRVHEYGEQAVVHPVTRDHTTGGDPIGRACQAEGERARRAIAELHDLGADHPGFGAKFAAFREAVLDGDAHEERDEWPLLRRYVPTQRLHTMANEIRNVQAMC